MVQIGDLLGIREWVVHTDARGRWSLTVGRQIVRRSHWRAVYLGSQVRRPSVSTRHVLYVVPPLSAKLGTHTVAAGDAFRFSGHTLGSLARRPVKAQIRHLGGRWRPLGPAGVTVTGRYGRVFTVPRRGRYQLRWRYHGDLAASG